MQELNLKKDIAHKKIYFLSDVHLGASALNNNREREIKLIKMVGFYPTRLFRPFFTGRYF